MVAAQRLLQAKRLPLLGGSVQAGGLCRANPGVESFLNDIPSALIFVLPLQVLWGTCPAHVNGEEDAVTGRLVFSAPLLCCFHTYSFRKGHRRASSLETKTFVDRAARSSACIITKYCQLHNIFINLSLQKASLEEISCSLACGSKGMGAWFQGVG